MGKTVSHHHVSKITYRFKRRIIIGITIAILICTVILSRLSYLQIYQHDRYTTLSNKNQISVVPISPKRGLIYDRNGVLLAENIPVYNLEVIADKVRNLDSVIEALKEVIDISEEDITDFYKKLRQRHSWETIPIRQNLTDDEVARFAVNQYKFPGVLVKARLIRHYPFTSTLAHVLGYVSSINSQEMQQPEYANYATTDSIGKIGVEKKYEHVLHGQLGYEEVETDASGRTVRVLNRIPPVSGNDIYLTIDSRLQKATEKSLKNNAGAAIAINPNNGEILAVASSPSYDLNLFVQGISQGDYNNLISSNDRPLYNRAINGQYPPASTIKPFIGIEALNSKAVTPEYTIFDRGYFELPNSSYRYRDWRRGGHGYINLRRAIIVSCDTYFYNLANMMGVKPIQKILEQFGFGSPTGIDLEGEPAGIVPSPEWKKANRNLPWYPGDTIITGIGQGFTLVTPLQLAAATAKMATRGISYEPHLVLKQVPADNQALNTTPKLTPVLQLEDEKIWDEVITAMDEVTTTLEGTGRIFGQALQYPVAAKTGTAQVFSSNRHEKIDHDTLPAHLRDHSLFIAFAPVDKPEIAIAVVVEHDNQASRVARKVMDAYFLGEHT